MWSVHEGLMDGVRGALRDASQEARQQLRGARARQGCRCQAAGGHSPRQVQNEVGQEGR